MEALQGFLSTNKTSAHRLGFKTKPNDIAQLLEKNEWIEFLKLVDRCGWAKERKIARHRALGDAGRPMCTATS
ncbi:MAG TPA: hypothetical protein VKB84_21345 [Candidatus Binataceae bacterium]|nr:hypothetical protein [Candidatus Binataceae bacterium]